MTADLAQCPECHFWFCKQHDSHECIPQIAHLQQQIKAAKIGISIGTGIFGFAVVAGAIWFFSLLCTTMYLGWETMLAGVEFLLDIAVITSIVVIFPLVLSFTILYHCDGRLRQLGVRVHGIRPPETAKKDR